MDISTISVTIAAIGIFIAAINSIITRREANRQSEREFVTRQRARKS
jgi:hypothetical protein